MLPHPINFGIRTNRTTKRNSGAFVCVCKCELFIYKLRRGDFKIEHHFTRNDEMWKCTAQQMIISSTEWILYPLDFRYKTYSLPQMKVYLCDYKCVSVHDSFGVKFDFFSLPELQCLKIMSWIYNHNTPQTDWKRARKSKKKTHTHNKHSLTTTIIQKHCGNQSRLNGFGYWLVAIAKQFITFVICPSLWRWKWSESYNYKIERERERARNYENERKSIDWNEETKNERTYK